MSSQNKKQDSALPPVTPVSSDTPSLVQAGQVVQFWREIGSEGWFTKNEAVDQRFRELFYDLHFAAARRQCEHWLNDADGAVGLMVLLDQFPRNVFRNTAHMFATDPLARHYARRIIDAGLIEQIDPDLRLFICLPFVHSEELSDQDYAQDLYKRYAPDSLAWASHHRSIIVQFGRFPHRNASLGRTTIPDEQQFLEDGGFTG